jgi:dienelactone hydrolase
MRKGQTPWTQATGRLARGFRSRIDGSIQPYGIFVPEPHANLPKRLDIWLHGRGNKLTELSFLQEQKGKAGEFAPEGTLVLHPYGRFCNAFKFAGETDVLEALAHASAQYEANPRHVALRGFSMGGAGTWHLAGHMTSRWAVASPGAGFAETAIYASVFAPGKPPVSWWEQVLWRLYDMPAHAPNLANRPVVVYSGEIDPQKQAADLMVKTAADAGITLPHLIGPQTGHKFHPETRLEVAKLVDEAAWKGAPTQPRRVHLTTFTLRYNTMDWVEIHALEKHWEKSFVTAVLNDDNTLKVETHGVTRFTLRPPLAGATTQCRITINGQSLTTRPEKGALHFSREGNQWKEASNPPAAESKTISSFEKKHGLQGPIDDAFMDAFVFVRATGKSAHPEVDRWARAEMDRAIAQWKIVFRGEVRVVDDTAVTPEMMSAHHLIVWGDPDSNAVIKKMLPKLPLEWGAEKLRLGTGTYEATHHAPVLIHPNPLAPNRYVVINSSFTFRQGSDTSNSLQTPKLPDWAVVDLRTPPDALMPGLVQDAGFFNENWR